MVIGITCNEQIINLFEQKRNSLQIDLFLWYLNGNKSQSSFTMSE